MTAFHSADILLPRLNSQEMTKWSAAACDQYTAQPEYWEETARIAGNSPSSLDLILPEIYLDESEKRIPEINKTMREYLKNGIFEEYKDCFVFVNRRQADGRERLGIVGAIDLEMYDFSKGSTSQVRATEATVRERIPPRVRIRSEAPLELPHIMILIDDPQLSVIEPLREKNLRILYDFELMQNGGHLTGRLVEGENAQGVKNALDALAEKCAAEQGCAKENALVFAMGDGNHSLATAKACYEQKKRENSPDAELARYALAEIVNLHSPALEFEAIHRVIFDVDYNKLLSKMKEFLEISENIDENCQKFTMIYGGQRREYCIKKPCSNLTTGSVQAFLDEFLKENGGALDYIHGEDAVEKLCEKGAAGILLPSMKKSELFETVIKDGVLPRKTFSMGHAHDKRFYCEARKIMKI